MTNKGEKLLRSRFQKPLAKLTKEFTASIPFDWRLYRQDITGSIAHVRMLTRQAIITQENADLILSGLMSIHEEIDNGVFDFKIELEDIHMNIESRLFEKIGDVAGQLHTGRSRNDQISLDMRLYMKEAINQTIIRLVEVQKVLLYLAEENIEVIMPGYTHLQKAQPILFPHYLLAYFEMMSRDIERFQSCLKRTDVLPLGSGALAGVTYSIDRDFLARELELNHISKNSIDAVSDRDFVLEYESNAAIAMMHLSRFAEEVIIFSSAEFGFWEIDEAYATTSSIMPQKKNPDVAELIRGKTGRVYGSLVSLLTVMKGLPLAYNRDMQEDKQFLFDVVDTLLSCLEIFSGMIRTLHINAETMHKASIGNYTLATDIADYLVRKGLSFRDAHNIVGKLVQYAASEGKNFSEMSLDEYRSFSTLFSTEIYDITVETSVADRNIPGGTAAQQVKEAIARAKEDLKLVNPS